MTEMAPQFEHERYEELCAFATAGVLTLEESELLTVHLGDCAECREAFAQYQSIATDGMPFLAGHYAATSSEVPFDKSSALARLMQAADGVAQQATRLAVMPNKKPVWNQAWVRGLVAASVIVAVGAGAYWTGARSADIDLQSVSVELQSSLEHILTEKQAEKQALEKMIQADRARIAVLEQQSVTDKGEVAKLRAEAETATQHLTGMTDAMNAAKKESDVQLAALTEERDAKGNKLRDAENMYQTVQEELNTLRSQHQQDLMHLASLETRADSLSADLNDQHKRTRTDEQFLISDRDIRDLIGARNLYIADIMDVNGSGQSRKPFGRIFYTKTKSLIFYAYDLDHQPGVKLTSTFQVWGRTSANDRKPINLGILYIDSEANRRWTMRLDNPAQLARLDAVFVTVEPREQSDKPSGKPFLYASLQRVPNHP
jgi:hypothetical protein